MEPLTGESGRDPQGKNHPRTRGVDSKLEEDIHKEIAAQAGDTEDRALHENGRSGSCSRSLGLEVDGLRRAEEGLVANGFGVNGGSMMNGEGRSLSSEAILNSRSENQGNASKEQSTSQQGNQKSLLVYISCYIHLAAFGILGVLVRYSLHKLFGPGIIGFTDDDTALYLDLPSNVVGSFLMGWLGIVFKGDISHFWDLLAIGLSTGFLGSLTTFSGWNQEMLELALKGRWAVAIIGFSINMLLVMACISMGIATAKGFGWLLARLSRCNSYKCCRVDYRILRTAILLVLILIWIFLWAVSIALWKRGIEAQETTAMLWLACIVGPPGVWLRWFLAGYNGHGFGRSRSMKWFPFGTLAANVLACILVAGSTTLKKAVNTKRCDIIVNGFNFGFPGCLSTVSTFVAEVYAMNQSKHPWRAYVYSIFTMVLSFVLGVLIYIIPVSEKGYP